MIDPGARSAMVRNGKSLLPVGIKSVRGKFASGSLVSIVDENEKEIARGLVNLDSETLNKSIGKKGVGEAIHRDNLVVLT